MTAEEIAELHEAVTDTRRIVKSLANHARSATALLTDLDKRLDRFEVELAQLRAQGGRENGKRIHAAVE